MPHELFRLSYFGFKNCAKLFRIKFLHQEIKLIFFKKVGVVPRKAAKLEKVVRNLSFITLIWYKKYLNDFATNNSNVWFFKHHTLSDLEI